MKNMKTWVSVAIVAVVATLWTGVAAETGVTKNEVVIGGCLPLTGPNESSGNAVYAGASLYVNYINAQGGINGRKIKYVVHDDKYDTNETLNCWASLTKEDMFIMGSTFGTATTSKYVRLAEANKVPALGFATGPKFIVSPTKHYIFLIRPSFVQESTQLTEHLINDLKVNKIAVVYQEDIGGIALIEGVLSTLTKYEKTFTASFAVSKTSPNTDAIVAPLQQSGAEAVLVLGPTTFASGVLKSLKSQGLDKMIVANISGRDALVKAAGDASEGVIISQVVPPPEEKNLPLVALYNREVKKAGKDKPSYYGLEGFLGMAVISEGLKRAGADPTRENFIAALETLHDYDPGVGQTISYRKDDHEGLRSPYFTIVHDGKLSLIKDWGTLKR